MPIYEYGCKSCGVTFEKFQRIDADPISEFEYCPNHQEGCEIQRLISAPSLVKGMENTTIDAAENTAQSNSAGGDPAQSQSPSALMANRAKSLQQQMQERLQSFVKYRKEKGK